MKENKIENCVIADTAKLGDLNTLINTTLGNQCMIGNFSKMAYSKMDTLSYIGDYTTVINSIIGKFTSISWGVTIGPEEHDYKRVTNHSFLYSTKAFQLVDKKQYSPFLKKCEIGHDVWIGCNCTILRGVTIGNGAVVGANSLVNKDVPPYAIVVGSPAKIIKYRFDKNLIAELLEIEWWNFPVEIISKNAELFAKEPSLDVINEMRLLKNTYNNE